MSSRAYGVVRVGFGIVARPCAESAARDFSPPKYVSLEHIGFV
jgi:hypothetical protein